MTLIDRFRNTSDANEKIELAYECLTLDYPPSLIKYCSSQCMKIQSQKEGRYATKLCIFTHNLSIEGAPYALLNHLKSFTYMNDPLITITPAHGELELEFSDRSKNLLIHSFLGDFNPESIENLELTICKIIILLSYVSPKQLFVNTTRGWIVALACQKLGIDYSWWIHEAETPFQFISNQSVKEHAIKTFKATQRLLFAANATKNRYLASIKPLNKSLIAKVVYPNATRDIFAKFKNNPEAINTQKDESRGRLGISPEKICILNIGTFCSRKNQLELLDAISKIKLYKIHRLKLLMIGSTLEEPSYSKKINQKVELINNMSQECNIVDIIAPTADIIDYYISSDYYIHSSTFECFSQTVNEAKSMCLDILVRSCEGMEEVLAGYSKGTTYSTFDELVKYLNKIIDQSL